MGLSSPIWLQRRRGGGAAPFDPDTIAGLQEWALSTAPYYYSSTLDSYEVLDSKQTYGTHRAPRQGRCYLFDGVNDFATSGTRLTSGSLSALSAFVWVKTTFSADSGIMSESLSTGSQNGWLLYTVGTTGQFRTLLSTNGSSFSKDYRSSAIINDGNWHHIGFVFDSGTLTIYVDGVVDAATAIVDGATPTIFNTTAPFGVGAFNIGGTPAAYLAGRTRDARVYTTAKTLAEVQAIYADGVDVVGLAGEYYCNEEAGTTAYDASGNARHLTLTNITPSTFHTADTGVTYNPNNEFGYLPIGTYSGKSSSNWSVNSAWVGDIALTGNFSVSARISAIANLSMFALQPTIVPTGQLFSQAGSVGVQVVSSSSFTRWLNGANTTVSATITANSIINYSRTGSTITISIDGISVSTFTLAGTLYVACWFSVSGSAIGVFPNGTQEIKTAYLGTDVNSSTLYVPSLASGASAADGNALTATGQCPYPMSVAVPCIAGDGASVYANLGSSLIPANAHFDLELVYYHTTNNTTQRVLVSQWIAGNAGRFSLTANANGIAGRFGVQIAGTLVGFVDGLTQNQWHRLRLSRSGNDYTLALTNINGVVTSSTFSNSASIFQTNTILLALDSAGAGAWTDGFLSDLKITSNGVTTYFPLQDGAGTSNTNRDLAYVRDNGTYGVVTNAIVNGTVANIWANRCPLFAKDWCVNYGGAIAANGAFSAGQISGSLAANGTTKTLVEGNFGNPYSRLNLNPFSAAEYNGRSIPTAYAVTNNLNGTVTPSNTGFRRTATDGDDRFLIYKDTLTGADLTNIQAYTA